MIFFFLSLFRGGVRKGKGWLGWANGWLGQWLGGERGDLSKACSLILHSAKRSHDAGGLATAVKAI